MKLKTKGSLEGRKGRMLREKKEISLLLSKLQVIVRRNTKRISAAKISQEKKKKSTSFFFFIFNQIHSDTRSEIKGDRSTFYMLTRIIFINTVIIVNY